MHIIHLIWMLTVNFAFYSPFPLKTNVRVQSQHQETCHSEQILHD